MLAARETHPGAGFLQIGVSRLLRSGAANAIRLVLSELLPHFASDLHDQVGQQLQIRRRMALSGMPEHVKEDSTGILLLLWKAKEPTI